MEMRSLRTRRACCLTSHSGFRRRSWIAEKKVSRSKPSAKERKSVLSGNGEKLKAIRVLSLQLCCDSVALINAENGIKVFMNDI